MVDLPGSHVARVYLVVLFVAGILVLMSCSFSSFIKRSRSLLVLMVEKACCRIHFIQIFDPDPFHIPTKNLPKNEVNTVSGGTGPTAV